jgi:FtsP/CotA-like multicopper oxidase with cupredoxin domain
LAKGYRQQKSEKNIVSNKYERRENMNKRKFLIFMCLALTMVALSWGIDQRAAKALDVDPVNGYYVPDYFLTPNWANSPPLQKFVDPMPGLYISGVTPAPPAGTQFIPVAMPNTTAFPGSDYYEIELGEYSQKMHSTLPATTLRGYRQTNAPDPLVNQFHYLGPLIIAAKDRPVRVKFTNSLPFGPPDPLTGRRPGDLFLPVDTTIMGSGEFEIDYDPITKQPIPLTSGTFTQNRATLHLHGGRTPWISDGTAHQWITPAGETTPYPRGVSVQNVPDMPDPGPGSQTFFWTNQQSSRLMFFHDHAWGITRLNVYAGEAAGYLLTDTTEQTMIGAGGALAGLSYGIPLIIQDKTFVNAATIITTDPTWAWGSNPGKPVGTPVTGDLWWPHVYMPAQNPFNPDLSGINAMGRWHYGPWFFPATPLCGSGPDAVPPFCINNGPIDNPYANPGNPNYSPLQPPQMPSAPNPSWGAEAFLDTMVVNGTAYPTLALQPQAYRFRVLNASHDRFLNLQLYKASSIVGGINLLAGGSGYTSTPTVTILGDGTGAAATAAVDLNSLSPTFGQVTAVNLDTVGSGYTTAAVAILGGGGSGAAATASVWTNLTEVGMVPAALTPGFPPTWPADGREGGVPDPATRGPAFIQIGTEGGFLPAPALLPNQPVQWNLDPTTFNVGNVLQQNEGGGTLILGPAERADVIVDFSNYSGQTLILYNDAPTAFPALDPHYDYYTGAPDRTEMGGYIAIPPGVGPNIRTVMQITVAAGGGATAPPDDYNPTTLGNLQTAFAGPTGAFQSSQEPIVVGQTAYNTTYATTFPATWPNWGISRISDGAISFQKVDGTVTSNFRMKPKAIHDEMGATFDDFGRMSAKLGLELPFANAAIANFVLQNFVDPPTELLLKRDDQIQIWRITHNGVDTHPIHFHLFDVQVLNRVGWDGFIRLPDPNELGWKDTVRMAPLEDTIVALRPILPVVPFPLPKSYRPLNPSTPLGSMMGFSLIDTADGGDLVPPTTNRLFNFGLEYTWHCHILSHEENDMMRAVSVRKRAVGDFDGDFKTDPAIFRTSTGTWSIIPSWIDAPYAVAWGGDASDKPAPGDYDGDGKADIAVYRVSNGGWYIIPSGGGPAYGVGWGGNASDIPVPGDYDGDDKTDVAIYRASTGAWYVIPSGGSAAYGVAWGGNASDIPAPGDYDGDGKTDLAVYRVSDGTWYIVPSWTGTAYATVLGGDPSDKPVPGDYDGDGTTDIAIYRGSDGSWSISPSARLPYTFVLGGDASDVPIVDK